MLAEMTGQVAAASSEATAGAASPSASPTRRPSWCSASATRRS
jgi:hypothetical protein